MTLGTGSGSDLPGNRELIDPDGSLMALPQDIAQVIRSALADPPPRPRSLRRHRAQRPPTAGHPEVGSAPRHSTSSPRKTASKRAAARGWPREGSLHDGPSRVTAHSGSPGCGLRPRCRLASPRRSWGDPPAGPQGLSRGGVRAVPRVAVTAPSPPLWSNCQLGAGSAS